MFYFPLIQYSTKLNQNINQPALEQSMDKT